MCSALYGPAGVSTSCDDLKEKLNTVRISDLTEEMHKRIVILEAAMANVNHGQVRTHIGIIHPLTPCCCSSFLPLALALTLACPQLAYPSQNFTDRRPALLRPLDSQQGIGFRIGGTVIDKKMLKVIFAKLAAVATTALPIVLAMGCASIMS